LDRGLALLDYLFTEDQTSELLRLIAESDSDQVQAALFAAVVLLQLAAAMDRAVHQPVGG
jgi:hypothetical protein